jgi:hypothetical protein
MTSQLLWSLILVQMVMCLRHETLRSALNAMLPRPDRPADPRPSHSFRVATPETKA